MKKVFMLDTNICSFIMRERPASLLLRLQAEVEAKNRLVISAITYAELQFWANSKKASPKMIHVVEEFVSRMDDVLAWDRYAVIEAASIKKHLASIGTPIGPNDTAIAGHAMAAACILVSNNVGEFSRVPGLQLEDWVA